MHSAPLSTALRCQAKRTSFIDVMLKAYPHLGQPGFRLITTTTNPADAHLNAAQTAWLEETYAQWKADPKAVHSSWDKYFRTGGFVAPPELTGARGLIAATVLAPSLPDSVLRGGIDTKVTKARALVSAFQDSGHLVADLDPLGLDPGRLGGLSAHPELTLAHYGFTDADLDTTIDLASAGVPGFKGFLSTGFKPITLRGLYASLQAAYNGKIGYEVTHLDNAEELNWLLERIETQKPPELTTDEQMRALRRLVMANRFDVFLKYNVKRFGMEGGESTIVALHEILRKSSDAGMDTCIMGMAHRGRLNVLANIVEKPYEIIFAEFDGFSDAGPPIARNTEGAFELERNEGIAAGDVKYHQGWSSTHKIDNGKDVHVSMLPNPSHLEAVNPLVMGKAKAKQFFSKDHKGDRIMSLLIHGDAAISGQGIVYESMAMQGLPDYNVGGTVHVIVNNQVGYTTDWQDSRSGPYCSDVAKAFRAPVIHVNGDDVESVMHAAGVAADYRAKFKRDVVLDVVCYRLKGHNELDNPSFTQPLMYQKIDTLFKAGVSSSVQLYEAKLLKGGRVTQEQVDAVHEEVERELKAASEKKKTILANKASGSLEQQPTARVGPNTGQYCTAQWEGLKDMSVRCAPVLPTAVPLEVLKDLGLQVSTIPAECKVHNLVEAAFTGKQGRHRMMETGVGLDWGAGEALAFATLLAEGFPVRLAGQDAQRGTFSHRHAVLHDQQNGRKYTPLRNLKPNKATAGAAGFYIAETPAEFTIVNSFLSEFGALGFEQGYSMDHPNQLVLWEAQFGDFVNGAQIILDNFLSSGEHKWSRQSGLVLLLPHGFEGQGAEHSSARMERFLQSANDDPNDMPVGDCQSTFRLQRSTWQVVNLTTPANYFHALRRQVKRSFRKPLIVMSPKSLLRAPISPLEDFAGATKFQVVIGDPHHSAAAASKAQQAKVKRHILCSGKVYYEVAEKVEKAALREQVAVTRIEQISPFPFHEVRAEDNRYPNADLVFVQEEHMNMGPWTYVQPRIETAVREKRGPQFRVRYIGRAPAAAAATGSHQVHAEEQALFVKDFLTL